MFRPSRVRRLSHARAQPPHNPDHVANQSSSRRRARSLPYYSSVLSLISFFFFNDTAAPEIYTLSLHDDLPICLQVLIQGTVQKLDERLRITARLVDVHTGRVIWAEPYDERADEPGGAQDAVGRAVAGEVGKRLSAPSNR